MIIDISEIISTSGKTESYSVPIDSEVFKLNGQSYRYEHKSPVTLTITNTGTREVLLTGHIDVSLFIPCNRCLEDVSYPFSLDIEKDIDFKVSDQERIDELDEMSYLDHSLLDVDQLVKNEILINFPMKVLCKEDCKGLCSRCGNNLNLGECGCDRESLDPRMSAILDIFNNFKEV